MSADLNGLDTLISVRGYFERILQERDNTDAEREKRLTERFAAQEKALAAALAERDKGLAAALEAAEKAAVKSEVANEKRFENANEWRGQSADRERTQQEQIALFGQTLLPRETFDAFQEAYTETIRRLESFQSRIVGAAIVLPIVTAIVTYLITRHP